MTTESHQGDISENLIETQTSHGDSAHVPTIYAEKIFSIGNFGINNSLASGILILILIIAFTVYFKRKIKKIPSKTQSVIEIMIDGAKDMINSVTNNQSKTEKIFPVVITAFLFVLISNWFGLLPGVGSIGFFEDGIFVPILRGQTADINTTLAIALAGVIGANIFGIISIGVWKYFNKFINIQAFINMFKHFKKEPAQIIVAPISFFVGLLEIIGEIAKVASLSFRLFGNIFAGEVLLASMSAILAVGLPLPFLFLEVLVGFIQAFIFAMLILVYFTIASEDHSSSH